MATPTRLATSTIKSVGTGGSTNFNVTGHTTDAGTDCLLVAVIWGGTTTSTVSAISWNGSGLTLLPSSTATQAGVTKIEWYYLLAPTIQGPSTLTITMSVAARGGAIAYNYQNVGQVTPFGTAATNTGGSNVNETVTVTSAAGELIVAALTANNGDTTTVTAGKTQVTNTVLTAGGTTNSVVALIEEASGAASVAMTGTLSTSRLWAASGVSIKGAAASGSWGPSLSDQLNRLVIA